MQLITDQNLLPYNTFGLNAKTHAFAEVHSIDELREVLTTPEAKQMPLLILGGGSNILLTKDHPGLVIKNSIKGIDLVKEDSEHVWLKAYAGEVWHDLVMYTVDKGLGGIENLSLIPGQVGAAPMQNIGAYGVELVQVFEELEALHIATGELHTFDKEACKFGYRESVFKHELKGQYVICSITIKLGKHPKPNTSYGAITDTLKEMGIEQPTVKDISNAVIAIRQSKLPDPKELGNAGSFFKNPEISKEAFDELQKAHLNVPHYPLDNGMVKVPAGWLIEQAGWKGKRIGNTGSHAKQALVLVNYGNATGAEIWQLAMDIQASVKQQFNITIKPEVNVI